MADIKTHLRELGVGVAIHRILYKQADKFEVISPKLFYEISCTLFKQQDIESIQSDFKKLAFSDTENAILKNSFELALVMVRTFKFNKTDKIVWCGGDSQSSSPVDLVIGKYSFSLKEESFILENMGLYKYLNLMTGLDFERGLHIFERFAPEEYQTLFEFVWNSFVDKKEDYSYKGSSYTSKAIFSKNSVALTYQGDEGKDVSVLPLEKNLKIEEFTRLTTSRTREKIFSKWVKENMEKRGDYLAIKKTVSELAAASLVQFVKKNLDKNYYGLKRFLRIHKESYYYAKSTNAGVQIFEVPSSKDFDKVFLIEDISWAVPESQVNIFTKIKNKKNGETLVFRNELRFSHGQFNGTPEAKMYYSREGKLDTIYERVV